jgi:hypothetical protein
MVITAEEKAKRRQEAETLKQGMMDKLVSAGLRVPSDRWFIQLYEEVDGEYRFNGAGFDPSWFGYELPINGDTIIAPLHKADFRNPRDTSAHVAYEVLRRYLVPDGKTKDEGKTLILRLLVKRRPLTKAEAAMWN